MCCRDELYEINPLALCVWIFGAHKKILMAAKKTFTELKRVGDENQDTHKEGCTVRSVQT